MDALRLAASLRFVTWMRERLRARQAPGLRDLDDSKVERRVLAAFRRAQRHGLTDEHAIAEFIELMFTRGPRFDRHPRMAAALGANDMSPELRFYAAMARMNDGDWAQARSAQDDDAWNRLDVDDVNAAV